MKKEKVIFSDEGKECIIYKNNKNSIKVLYDYLVYAIIDEYIIGYPTTTIPYKKKYSNNKKNIYISKDKDYLIIENKGNKKRKYYVRTKTIEITGE